MISTENWAERVYSRLGWRTMIVLPVFVWVTGAGSWVLTGVMFVRLREVGAASRLEFVVIVGLLLSSCLAISVLHALRACQPLRQFSHGRISGLDAWRSAVGLPYSLVKVNYAIAALIAVPGGLFAIFKVDEPSAELGLMYLLAAIGIWLYILALGVFLANVILRPLLRDIGRHLDGPPPAVSGVLLTKRLLFVVPGLSVATAMVGAGVALSPGEDLGSALIRLLVATVLSAAITLPVTLLLAKSVREPIADLLDGTKRIKTADYTTPVPELSSDELGQLARSFNEAMEGLTERQRLARENMSLLDEVRASRARIVAASDASRRRIERNLHDGAQQRLVALALDLRLHEENARSMNPDDVAAAFSQATQDVKEALAELRELARGLHPSVLTTDGLAFALDQLAARAKLPVAVHATAERFEPAVESAAYFVAAEALANVAKYAHASQAHVTAEVADGRLLVEVADDGVGGASLGSGTGLAGLADRVAALDGTLEIDSPVGRGTKVIAHIPVDGKAAVSPNGIEVKGESPWLRAY